MKKLNKIGIITFTYGDNYGQRLQNYAVQELLKKYSDNVVTIPRSELKSKGIKLLIKDHEKKIFSGLFWAYFKRKKAFRNFDRKYIKYNKYRVNNEYLRNEKEFDCFIAGSDQIWSPYSCDVDTSMFLTFTNRKKRISLSPSIAAKEIPESKRELYKEYWDGFGSLSIRENKSAEIIKEICGKEAEVLIDPTLALDKSKWDQLENESELEIEEKYILLYCLGVESISEPLKSYSDKKNYSIIDLFSKRYIASDPCDFLRLIKNAQLVITDSYHGTIFSIIYHVPFIVIERKGNGPDMSSRFDTLFEILSVNNRTEKFIDMDNIENIDFNEIDNCIKKEQEKLYRYLDENIEKSILYESEKNRCNSFLHF